MKRQALLLFAAIFSILIALTWHSCNSCNTPPLQLCNLPAPELDKAAPTSPTTATIDWSDVPGAVGYRVIVTDLTDSTIFGTFNPTESFLNLTGLTPFHTYSADIRAKCA
ncbi:MAG: fibronectin type III domain-containing protein [Saprospiraceae bacterium]|nr:fibronectin type III domain-containing protein [Saprospiraceae bacterium]